MKICILTSRFPFPQYSGGILRINEICRYLKGKGHTLILVSLSDEKNPPVEEALSLYDKVYFVKRSTIGTFINCVMHFLKGKPLQCGYYSSSKYMRLLRDVIAREQPDMYLAHLLRMVPYLEALGVEDKSIVEMTDALSKTYTLSSNAKGGGLIKYIYKIEHRLIEKYEKKVIERFPKVVLVSQADVDYLVEKDFRTDSLCVYTNGVSILENKPDTYDNRKMCFIGSMGFLPNQDAVRYFMDNIYLLLKKVIPDMKFHIVGSRPTKEILQMAEYNKDIIVTGFVDNLNEYISDSCVTVAPIRIAAGIQNKVLVSMGCGVPVVLTSLISKAITELKDGENCFVADTPENIANACIKIFKDSELRNRMGAKGYEVVKKHYDWSSTLEGYEIISAL